MQAYSCDVHYTPETSQWQMWYEGHPAEVLLCTAFSNDGIHWTKPALGIEEWNGSRENNIILQTGYWDANCASIVKAPTETDPARRYKLYYWASRRRWVSAGWGRRRRGCRRDRGTRLGSRRLSQREAGVLGHEQTQGSEERDAPSHGTGQENM